MSDKEYIFCIGVDQKIHLCESHLGSCKCGVKVFRKKVKPRDYENRFSCYECTY